MGGLDRILLIESGSRRVAENWLSGILARHADSIVDLLTCFQGTPAGFPTDRGAVYRTADYASKEARAALTAEFRRNRYETIAILCTGEPIMARWKWFIVWQVKSKVLIVNENSDYFWVDRGNWRTLAKFAAYRLGMSGTGAILQPLRVLVFPFTIAWLALYAAQVHIRRRLRA